MKSLQLDKPHAIVMVGIQGSGKTFFASKFSETFHAPYVEQAAIAAHLANEEASEALIDLMLTEILKTRHSVVIETDTATRVARAQLAKRLRDAGYVPLFVWVQVDAETAKQRSLKKPDVTAEEHAEGLKRFSAPTATEKALVISGKHTYATQARIVLKKLSAPRAAATAHRPAPARGQIIVR